MLAAVLVALELLSNRNCGEAFLVEGLKLTPRLRKLGKEQGTIREFSAWTPVGLRFRSLVVEKHVLTGTRIQRSQFRLT